MERASACVRVCKKRVRVSGACACARVVECVVRERVIKFLSRNVTLFLFLWGKGRGRGQV